MSVKSSPRSFLAVAATIAALAAPAVAAPKGPPPSPSPSPSPVASPTATPEPLDVAIPRLENKLKTDPNDKATQADLAQDYYAAGRPDLTLGLTQKLIAGGTKTAQVYYLDGVANAQLGRTKEATADLENASNSEPTNVAVLGALTTLYLRANRPADAERVAKRAITFNKNDKEAYDEYGAVLAAEQKYDDARAQFENAAKIDPKDAHPVVLEARSYVDQKAIALAAQTYDRAVSIDPKSQEALIGKARVQAEQHNVPGAVATYNALLALVTSDEDKVAVLGEIAHTYAVEKMTSDADKTYHQAIDTYPKVSAGHLQYGDYLAYAKDLNGAEREWIAADGPNRDNPEALSRLGEYYAGKNDLGRATDVYKRLTEVSPRDPRSFLLLANVYRASRQYDRAREAFKQSYVLSHSAEALVGLGDADFQTHNYREAAQIFGALDKSQPAFTKANPQMLYVLGQSYQRTGETKKARDAYVRFLPFTKPGSQANTQIKALIAQIDQSSKPVAKPAPQSTKAPQKK